jgi:hypothetical protein
MVGFRLYVEQSIQMSLYFPRQTKTKQSCNEKQKCKTCITHTPNCPRKTKKHCTYDTTILQYVPAPPSLTDMYAPDPPEKNKPIKTKKKLRTHCKTKNESSAAAAAGPRDADDRRREILGGRGKDLLFAPISKAAYPRRGSATYDAQHRRDRWGEE